MLKRHRPHLLLLAIFGSLGLHAASTGDPDLRDRIVGRLAAPGEPVHAYRALRHLTASARGRSMSASLDAWTTLGDSGLTVDVVGEEGSAVIRKHVLKAALAAERDLLASGEARQGAIVPENYDFPLATGEADGLARLTLKPRRRHRLLLNGSVLVDVDSADIVSVEGLLSKRPSFWTRRVHVERRYARIAGRHVPVSTVSEADVLLAGASRFEMTYCYSEIDGVPVGECAGSTPAR